MFFSYYFYFIFSFTTIFRRYFYSNCIFSYFKFFITCYFKLSFSIFCFSSSVYDYTIKIGNEDRLNITYTTADSKSDVTVTGNENLENGSIIKVTVVAEDGTTTIYKINVEKVNTKNVVIISVMAFLLVTLVVLSVILVKSRKKQTF